MANVCNTCHREFSSTSSLRRHKRDIHDGLYLGIPVHKKQTPIICSTCNKRFATRSSYNRHDREVHKQEVPHYVELVDTVTRFHCIDCNTYFYSNMDLRFHLDEKHDEPWELDKMEFASDEEFQSWLLAETASNKLCYVLARGTASADKCYYECWRSASSNYNPLKTDRKRAIKKVGSCKMPFACTSQIIVHKDPFAGNLKVSYFKTHYGHEYEDDVMHLNRSSGEQEGIVLEHSSEISPKKIFRITEAKQSKRSSREPLKRQNLRRKEDIENIPKSLENNSKSSTSEIAEEDESHRENIELRIIKEDGSDPIDETSEEPETINNDSIISQIDKGIQILSSRIKDKEYPVDHLQAILKHINASLESLDELDSTSPEIGIADDVSEEIYQFHEIRSSSFDTNHETIREDSFAETIGDDVNIVNVEEVPEAHEEEYIKIAEVPPFLNEISDGISDVTDSDPEVITINLGDFENGMCLDQSTVTIEYAEESN